MKPLAIGLGTVSLLFLWVFSLDRQKEINENRFKNLKRGDEVVLIHQKASSLEFYQGCTVYFIDSVSISNDNIALVTLNNCGHIWFKNKPIYAELRSLNTIKKIAK